RVPSIGVSVMLRLRELLRGVDVLAVDGDLDLDVGELRDDSRAVVTGDVFVAVRGHAVDGHDFVAAAAQRGARAVIAERDVPFQGTRVRVASTQRALGKMAANRFGNPAQEMVMIGVTGTNGKTTTTYLIESMLAAAGRRVGLIGTVGYRYGGTSRVANLTTPG